MEHWKKTLESDKYEVSDMGRIRNATNGYILNPGHNTDGYLKVTIHGNTKLLHRIVGHAFLGYSDLCINHKDGVKDNNSIDNLEFVTVAENNLHAIKNGLNKLAPISSIGFDGTIVDYGYMNDAIKKTGISRKMIGKNLYGERRSTHGLVFFHTGQEPPLPVKHTPVQSSKRVLYKAVNGLCCEYESIGDASRKTGKDKRSISRWCNGATKCKDGGWSFVE